MAEPNGESIARGFAWAGRIFAAVMMMGLPGLAGRWLDRQWGVNFLSAMGFVGGLVGGMTYLIAATRAEESARLAAKRDAQAAQPSPNGKDRT